jgi:hypothetical protein
MAQLRRTPGSGRCAITQGSHGLQAPRAPLVGQELFDPLLDLPVVHPHSPQSGVSADWRPARGFKLMQPTRAKAMAAATKTTRQRLDRNLIFIIPKTCSPAGPAPSSARWSQILAARSFRCFYSLTRLDSRPAGRHCCARLRAARGEAVAHTPGVVRSQPRRESRGGRMLWPLKACLSCTLSGYHRQLLCNGDSRTGSI